MADQAEPLTLKERAKAIAPTFAAQRDPNWWNAEKDDYNRNAMSDELTDVLVKHAVVTTKAERATMTIPRDGIVGYMLPDLPDKNTWADQDDPALAETIYDLYDAMFWRMLDIAPTARVQSRLNSDHGLILCRTRTGKKPYDVPAVYVTRNHALVIGDAYAPMADRQLRQAARDAAFSIMVMERIPEKAEALDQTFNDGLASAHDAAKALSASALKLLQASASDGDDPDDDPDGNE